LYSNEQNVGLEIPWRRTCGKNITHRGRKDEDEFLVAAKCNKTKNVGDRDIWRRNTEEAWAWASSSAGCRGGGGEGGSEEEEEEEVQKIY
jgi:hypothetical protein